MFRLQTIISIHLHMEASVGKPYCSDISNRKVDPTTVTLQIYSSITEREACVMFVTWSALTGNLLELVSAYYTLAKLYTFSASKLRLSIDM